MYSWIYSTRTTVKPNEPHLHRAHSFFAGQLLTVVTVRKLGSNVLPDLQVSLRSRSRATLALEKLSAVSVKS